MIAVLQYYQAIKEVKTFSTDVYKWYTATLKKIQGKFPHKGTASMGADM